MSHFSLLFVGTDPETALAPYNEQDEKTYTPHDMTEDLRKDWVLQRENERFLKHCKKHHVEPDVREFVQWWQNVYVIDLSDELQFRTEEELIKSKQDYAIVNTENEEVIKSVRFWNDNAKYDYYQVVSKEPIENLDIDGIIAEKEAKRAEEYDRVFEVLGHVPSYKSWSETLQEVWEEVKDEHPGESLIDGLNDGLYDEVDKRFTAQEDIKTLHDNGLFPDDDIRATRDEYIAGAELPFCAIATDHGWVEKGTKTGWWGITLGTPIDTYEWREKHIKAVKDMISECRENGEECFFWVIDCHI